MLNPSIQYHNGVLEMDQVPLPELAHAHGTPTYIYSLPRAISNFHALTSAFPGAHSHYSAKANANLRLMRALIEAGAGIDAVSAGEIAKALAAGVAPEQIVFAGVGKHPDELRFAVEKGIGWINVENRRECDLLNEIAETLDQRVQVALRYNPEVQANTHPHIATGHKSAKFGLNKDDISYLLAHTSDYPAIDIHGVHVHVGSQLADTQATEAGVRAALDLVRGNPEIHTINLGGGFPAAYDDTTKPDFHDFARAVMPLLEGYNVILEPGRSIVADAGVLVTELLYVKEQGGQTIYIVDASMTELLRPALYGAKHQILPVNASSDFTQAVNVVGPVCETTDTLGTAVPLANMQPGDLLAILDVGAYGMVMASNYNQRPRPPEIVTVGSGRWELARRRETLEDILRFELVENKTG